MFLLFSYQYDKKYLSVSFFWLLLFSSQLFVSVPHVHADGNVVINEFVVHPSSGKKEWVELYNPDNSDLSQYWIDDDTNFTDDSGSSSKKSLAAMVQGQDATHPYIETSSMFNNDGDTLVLFDSNGTIVDQYTYTSDPGVNIALGRFPDGTGTFQILASATQGSANTSPAATNTPTAAPTAIPTDTPKPTHIPTPTKVPTPTKISTTNKTTTAIITKNTVGDAGDTENFNPSIDLSGLPTSILGISTQEATATRSASPSKNVKEHVLLKSSRTNNTTSKTTILFIIGGILLIACGILVFWKKYATTIHHQ